MDQSLQRFSNTPRIRHQRILLRTILRKLKILLLLQLSKAISQEVLGGSCPDIHSLWKPWTFYHQAKGLPSILLRIAAFFPRSPFVPLVRNSHMKSKDKGVDEWYNPKSFQWGFSFYSTASCISVVLQREVIYDVFIQNIKLGRAWCLVLLLKWPKSKYYTSKLIKIIILVNFEYQMFEFLVISGF